MGRWLIAAVLAALPAAAGAHEIAKGPNGEMVASGTELTLYLTGEGEQPLASAGSRNARAVIREAGKTATISLQPAAPNVQLRPSRS